MSHLIVIRAKGLEREEFKRLHPYQQTSERHRECAHSLGRILYFNIWSIGQ